MRYNNQDLVDCGNQMLGIENFGGCTLNEYHKYLLKLLSEIDRICRKNDIKYFLMYGSLIGAVRHNGFIPWDDDADIAMTREEFNKFQECCRNELGEEFDLVTYNDDENYNYTFPKLRLKNTTYIIRSEISRHGRNAGFFIDIIIMDYLYENKIKSFIQKRTMMALHRLVSPGFFQNSLGLNFFEDALVSISKLLLGKRISVSIAEKIISSADPDKSSSLVAEIFLPTVNYFYIYDKHHFEKSIDICFEDKIFAIPVDSLTLLHNMYFRNAKLNHSLLSHNYEDENDAIINHKLWHYNNIMFIPTERNRDRHLDVVFDCNHNSSYYDVKYFEKFNKKKNDNAAVRERKYREKAQKFLLVMNENEDIARNSCTLCRVDEYFEQLKLNKVKVENLSLKEASKIVNDLLNLSIRYQQLDREQRIFLIEIMLKTGHIAYALSYCQMFEYDYPEQDISKQKKYLQYQLDTYYSFLQNDIESIKEYVGSKKDDFLSKLFDAILSYESNDFDSAEDELYECLDIDDSCFWAYYYLGLILMVHKKNIYDAEKMFREALNTTNYMPLLQMALDKINECSSEAKSSLAINA